MRSSTFPNIMDIIIMIVEGGARVEPPSFPHTYQMALFSGFRVFRV